MIIPELPDFIRQMGGADYIGYTIGLFTLSAAISRPISGVLTDRNGRIKIMLFGSAITTICGLLYPFAQTVWLFLALRFIHGIATGFRPTAATTYLTDIVPRQRRGEAMGYLGMSGSIGMAMGPVLGSVLREEFSFEVMFYTSTLLGLLSFILTTRLRETVTKKTSIVQSFRQINASDVLERSALPTSIIMVLDTFSFGVILTVAPDFVKSLGFEYKGLFNAIFVLASISMRFFAGQASDRYGRVPLLRIGTVVLVISLLILGFANSVSLLVIGAILYGMSIGINRPTIFAWTTDLANPEKIGKALATMLLALEIGIGAGAFISGEIYNNDLVRIPYTFFLAAFIALLSLIYLLFVAARFEDKQKKYHDS
jgi:MFS family permease